MTPPTASVGREPDRGAQQARGGARADLEVLDEEHGLEAFAVDAGEAEDAEPERLAGEEADPLEPLALPVEARDPLAPVDAVEEPVGDHEQDRDREQAGDRLEPQPAGAELGDEQLREPPRDRSGGDAGQPAEQHRAPQAAPGADERGGDGGEDEHRLEPLAEDDDRRVGDDRAAADAHVAERLLGRAQRIARPVVGGGDAGAAVERGEHAGVLRVGRPERGVELRGVRAEPPAERARERVRLQRLRVGARLVARPVGGERAVELGADRRVGP